MNIDIITIWQDEIADLDARNDREWESLGFDLDCCQYAYIKFGLLLEKIRNRSFWKYCRDKFASFKQFCQRRLAIECWQADRYIEAARVAIHLAESGFTQLPKNFTQAATLIKAYKAEIGPYLERPELVRVWDEVLANNPTNTITAAAINRTIDPNWESRQPAKLPKRLTDRATKIAKSKGMTVDEYLEDLMNADERLDEFTTEECEIEDELNAVLDALDIKFASYNQNLETNDRQTESKANQSRDDRPIRLDRRNLRRHMRPPAIPR